MKSKKDFSEHKNQKIKEFFIWQDIVKNPTCDFSAYCVSHNVPNLLNVFQSLYNSLEKFGPSKGTIFCDEVSREQIISLEKEGFNKRIWIRYLKLIADPTMPKQMLYEKETLQLTMGSADLNEIIKLLQKYSANKIHAFSAFSVPKKTSKNRESTSDLHFFYNLQGID